jgi:uncharacterized membrane protein YvbJ
MSSRYCLQCGASVRDDDSFCGKCGASLTTTARTPKPNEFDPWAQSAPPPPREPSPDVANPAATQMLLVAVAVGLAISIGAAVFVLAAAGN